MVPGSYLIIVNYFVAGLAILTMGACVIRCFTLLSKVPGGVIRKRIGFLLALLVFFFFGYLASPFFYFLERFEYTTLVVYLVFFFGAVFVLISIGTIGALLRYIGVSKPGE
ncbi:MAG: hypothetical protein JSW52_03300 [Candidatus Coatesbacteria bacterium]|nr:MAG: hypothetical protein JSW52_03300 [Candidatus Coatesbacteria bacterium]